MKIISFGKKLSEKEVKVDEGFRQSVLRQIYATRNRSIVRHGLYEADMRSCIILADYSHKMVSIISAGGGGGGYSDTGNSLGFL